MSISGSQEVKSAVLHVDGVVNDTKTVQLDAQEDREIVGLSVNMEWHMDVSQASDIQLKARCWTYIGGPNPLPGADQANDNRSFFIEAHVKGAADDSTGEAMVDAHEPDVWYGEGSGIEWNEDSTLNVEVENDNVSNASDAIVTVYYREL